MKQQPAANPVQSPYNKAVREAYNHIYKNAKQLLSSLNGMKCVIRSNGKTGRHQRSAPSFMSSLTRYFISGWNVMPPMSLPFITGSNRCLQLTSTARSPLLLSEAFTGLHQKITQLLMWKIQSEQIGVLIPVVRIYGGKEQASSVQAYKT